MTRKQPKKRVKSATAAATVSVEEAARRLGIGRNQAYTAAAKGEIPAMRVGKRWLIPAATLARLLGEVA